MYQFPRLSVTKYCRFGGVKNILFSPCSGDSGVYSEGVRSIYFSWELPTWWVTPTISCCLWPGCSVSMHTAPCTWFWKRENLQLSPDVLLLLLLLWNHILLCSLSIQHSINTQFIIISHLQNKPQQKVQSDSRNFLFWSEVGKPTCLIQPLLTFQGSFLQLHPIQPV